MMIRIIKLMMQILFDEEEIGHSENETIIEDSNFQGEVIDSSIVINSMNEEIETRTNETEMSEKVMDFTDARDQLDSENQVEKEEEMVKMEEKPVSQSKSSVKKEKPTVSQECIIVIGSFSKNKNSNNIKNKLKNDGYEIFEAPYKGLKRIGVYPVSYTHLTLPTILLV